MSLHRSNQEVPDTFSALSHFIFTIIQQLIMDAAGEPHTLTLTVTCERLNVREKLTPTFNFA